MLIIIVTIFLVTEVPLALITLLTILQSEGMFTIIENYHIKTIITFSNFFILCTYPLNFGLYCSMSQEFRRTFKKLIFGEKKPNISEHTETTCENILWDWLRLCGTTCFKGSSSRTEDFKSSKINIKEEGTKMDELPLTAIVSPDHDLPHVKFECIEESDQLIREESCIDLTGKSLLGVDLKMQELSHSEASDNLPINFSSRSSTSCSKETLL